MYGRAVGIALATAALVLAMAPAAAQTASAPVLEQRVAELASGFCVDVLSHSTALPDPGDSGFYARYGLKEGMPSEALNVLGPNGAGLVSRATLASGTASDGAFVVALGGAGGETCRIIVYRAPLSGLAVQGSFERLKALAFGWKALPVPPQPAGMLRIGAVKRTADGKPYLANLVAPIAPGPIAMILTVAAVPANVALPEGF